MSDHNPIGFVSYVRMDDTYEQGKIAEFQQRLQSAARLTTGDSAFRIFFDRNDIEWGQNWRARIAEAVDSTSFLIPIMTPAYFKSTACRDELSRFIEREKRLGRVDLILPVYYVTAAELERAASSSDPLTTVLAERQYVDWRELRFEGAGSAVLARAFANLAEQLATALESRASPEKASAQSETPSPEPPGPTEVAGPPTADAAPKAAQPRPTTETPTFTVSVLPPGDFTSIGDAIADATPGGRIVVMRGVYEETVRIDKPIELIGGGELGDVVIQQPPRSPAALIITANIGRIANIHVRATGEANGVTILQGRVDIEDCDISAGSQGAAIAVGGTAAPRIRRVRLHDSAWGAYFAGQASGQVEDSEIVGCQQGIRTTSASSPLVRQCQLHGGQWGIVATESSAPVVEGSEVYSHGASQIFVAEQARPTIRDNRVHHGLGFGIERGSTGPVVVTENEIYENALANVGVSGDAAAPTIRHNKIRDGHEGGVMCTESSAGRIEDNDIFGNVVSGIELRGTHGTLVVANRINRNRAVGVFAHKAAQAAVERNDLRNNAAPTDIQSDSTATVTL